MPPGLQPEQGNRGGVRKFGRESQTGVGPPGRQAKKNGPCRNRTCDPRIKNPVLYLLS